MSTKPAPQDQAFALAMFASAAQNLKQTSPNELAHAASAAITAALNAAAKNPPRANRASATGRSSGAPPCRRGSAGTP